MMKNHFGTYILDAASGFTFLKFGVIDGHGIALFLGGLASIFTILNHADQYYDRKFRNKK